MADSKPPARKIRTAIIVGCLAVIVTLVIAVGGMIGLYLQARQRDEAGIVTIYTPPPNHTPQRMPSSTAHIPSPPAVSTLSGTPEADATRVVIVGHYYWKIWDLDTALDTYNRHIEQYPKDATAYVGRALTYHRMDDDDMAQADLATAAVIDSQNIELLLAQGDIAIDKAEPDKAIQFYTQAANLDPHDARAYTGIGVAHFLTRQYDLALEDLALAEETDPDYAGIYNARGLIYYRSDYFSAMEEFRRAAELDPMDPIYLINLANANKHLLDFDEAENFYNQAIALAPHFAGAYESRARYHYDRAQYEPALDLYSQAIEANWGINDSVYYWRGLSYAQLKQYGPAVSDFGVAIDYNPNACLYNNRCSANIGLGNYEDAIDDCTTALELGAHIETYFNRARAYDRLDMAKEAVADYQTFIQNADPSLVAAIYAQERIEALGGGQLAVCSASVLTASLCSTRGKAYFSLSEQDEEPLLFCND